MLRAVVVSVAVVLAGCSAPLPVDSTATPTRTSPPSYATESTAQLGILSQVPFSLTIHTYGEQEVVLNESFSGITKVEYGEEGAVFRAGEDYRVTIQVNGTVRWNRTVTSYEWYELDIAANGSVLVRTHAVE
jgi:hypothetical protein